MPGLIINGEQVSPKHLKGFVVQNYKDDERLARGIEDGTLRNTTWVRSIVVHTTKGIPGRRGDPDQYIIEGPPEEGWPNKDKEFRVAKFWRDSPVQSGAHLVIDTDGSIGCIADLAKVAMFHAGQRQMNEHSIGVEIYQESDGGITEASLDACVALCNALCEMFGIQKQVQWPYKKGPVGRLSRGGRNCVGVFGHRDITSNRGFGDPGDFIIEKLIEKSNYEAFDYSRNEDLEAWKPRQKNLGLDADGVAGPNTWKALKGNDYNHGMWVDGKEEPLGPVDPVFDEKEVLGLIARISRLICGCV